MNNYDDTYVVALVFIEMANKYDHYICFHLH